MALGIQARTPIERVRMMAGAYTCHIATWYWAAREAQSRKPDTLARILRRSVGNVATSMPKWTREEAIKDILEERQMGFRHYAGPYRRLGLRPLLAGDERDHNNAFRSRDRAGCRSLATISRDGFLPLQDAGCGRVPNTVRCDVKDLDPKAAARSMMISESADRFEVRDCWTSEASPQARAAGTTRARQAPADNGVRRVVHQAGAPSADVSQCAIRDV